MSPLELKENISSETTVGELLQKQDYAVAMQVYCESHSKCLAMMGMLDIQNDRDIQSVEDLIYSAMKEVCGKKLKYCDSADVKEIPKEVHKAFMILLGHGPLRPLLAIAS